MEATASRKLNCQICGRAFLPQNGAIGDNVRPSLAEFIKLQRPNWDPQQFICFGDLGAFRKDYVKQALEDEIGELTSLDQEVIESLQQHELLTENIEEQFERKLTFGEHLSDKIAEFGGSWKFIITFGSVIVVWIVLNVLLLLNRGFDPYPFILLNLILSCLAALQAPVIMMSQNRAEARDRLRAENDYKVNLKAELEIRHLHEKIDHLLRKQYNRLFEIQQIQIELLEEISQRKRGSPRESTAAAWQFAGLVLLRSFGKGDITGAQVEFGLRRVPKTRARLSSNSPSHRAMTRVARALPIRFTHDRPISMIASTPRTIATPAVAIGAGIRFVKVARSTRMDARGTPAIPLDVIMKATIMESCCAKPKCCPTLGPAACTIKIEVTARKIIEPSRLKE